MRAWALAGAYVGSVIGAGFASGQELLRFFAVFGTAGLRGIALAGLLFMICGAFVLEKGRQCGSGSHGTLLTALCGPSLAKIFDLLLSTFLFASLGVMLAAAGELLNDRFGLPFTFGVCATALMTRLVVLGDASRLLRVNGILVAVLLGLTLATLVPVVLSEPPNATDTPTVVHTLLIPQRWYAGALLYTSFNLTFALSPLAALGATVRNRRDAVLGAIVAGAALALTGTVVIVALLQNAVLVAHVELPILTIIKERSPNRVHLYGIALYLAVLTSCIGAAYGLGHRLGSGTPIESSQVAGWLPILAVPIAYAGFATLVQTLYPVVGYTGLATCALAAMRSVTDLRISSCK